MTMSMSGNSNYQRDVRRLFRLINWILGSIGIWPIAIRYASELLIALGNFVLAFAVTPCFLYMIREEINIEARLKLCGLLAFGLTAIVKYNILVIRRPKILRCIEYVKRDWRQVTFDSDRRLMLQYAAVGRKLTIISASFMYSAGIIYHAILPFCSGTKNGTVVRPLVYPIYGKFQQFQMSPVYEMVYVLHCMCGYTLYSITVGVCALAALFATHACGRIKMILSRLDDLSNGQNFGQTANRTNRRIAAIVEDHVRVMRFTVAVEEVLQEVSLVEFTSSMCTICLLEYFCIVDWRGNDRVGLATYSLLFVSFCFNLYILCYIGELLMDESSRIATKCYTIDWYEISPKSARDLVFIIAASSHPIKISAGRMIDLSVETFANVLKTSLAYLSFLRTLVV